MCNSAAFLHVALQGNVVWRGSVRLPNVLAALPACERAEYSSRVEQVQEDEGEVSSFLEYLKRLSQESLLKSGSREE